jgi:Cu/Ag efflux protein CusF
MASQEVRALPEGEIFSLISDGRQSGGMPAFKGRIKDEAIWQIVMYVKQLSNPQATKGQNTVAGATPSGATPSPPVQAAPAVAVKRYPLNGKVISIQREAQEITVEHEEIPGYMGAMTMPFPLRDKKTLEKLKKDDRIQATLIIDRNGWRLENVVIR